MNQEEKKIKQLQKLLSVMDEDSFTTEDFVKHFEVVIQLIQESRDLTEKEIDAMREGYETILADIKSGSETSLKTIKEKLVADCNSMMEKMMSRIDRKLEEVDEKILMVKDGEDADEKRVIEEVLKQIPPAQIIDLTPLENKIKEVEEKIVPFDSKRLDDIERIAKSNATSMPVTTTFVNGKRAKNLNFTGATVTYQDDTATVAITGGGGTPGGSTTQLQYNNAGAFGGISGATTDGTAVTFATNGLLVDNVKASTSAGVLIESANGTDVGIFGAGNTANSLLYGGLNITGHLLNVTDNTYDIGASGVSRFRTAYLGTSLFSPLIYGSSAANGDITIEGTTSATKTSSYVLLQPTEGNVGIGISAPTNKLHIVAPESNGNSSTGNAFYLQSSTGAATQVVTFGVNQTGLYSYFQAFESGVGYSKLAFNPNGGNVGVGTNNPSTLFDINGVTTFRGNIIAGTDNTYDIGASGATRPRTGYFGTSIVTPLLTLGTGSITMTGSIAATGARVTKGWFTDIETTNMPTVGGTAILTSLTAPTFNTIELGTGQTDTTLSRSAAGTLAVEGVDVLTTSNTKTVSNKTLSGAIPLEENASIDLDPALSADGKYSGICITGTAGTTLAFGDLCYLASADSRWELADADAASTADRMMGMCVLAAAADGDPTKILLQGNIRADAAFPTLTIGSAVYVGETAGDIQVAIPTGADNVIRRVGYALTADELYFNPSMDSQTTVA